AFAEEHASDDAKEQQSKVLRRIETKGVFRKHRPEESDHGRCEAPGKKRRQSGSREGSARPSLLCHLVAIETGHYGRCLARQVAENGGRRASVCGAVVDAG